MNEDTHRVREGDLLRCARVPKILSRSDLLERGLSSERRDEVRHYFAIL